MKIREAVLSDIEALSKLRMEFLEEEDGPVSPELREALPLQWSEYFKAHLGKDCFVFLAENGEGVGSTAFLLIQEKPGNPNFPSGRTGLILNVYTRPHQRRTGLATLVLGALITEARRRGLDRLELSATPSGVELYRRVGFREGGSFTEMRLKLFEGGEA